MSDRVSTGSLGERLILRTSSTRGSVRETLTKAIRSTLRRATSSDQRKSQNSSTPMEDSSSSPRSSASSTPRTPSSGFNSMSHLPPMQSRKSSEPPCMSQSMSQCMSQSMSQSMYVQPTSLSLTATPRLTHRKYGDELSRGSWLPSTPNLHELHDYDHYDDYDVDDGTSVISSASTSRIFSSDLRRRHLKNQSLRMFLSSPGGFVLRNILCGEESLET
ncbi:unnamed protein product [Caenorhabditis auriculariae]|uniref:Uncharacterized protein n=1 Tax=Caenorhabditis auriculariae TaxID=2777116 RepID=A0A8S1HU36_9PELO|nr:unnamed protein product [Caenorhabditis auriculariae]